jgi:hypothetical protein
MLKTDLKIINFKSGALWKELNMYLLEIVQIDDET